MPAVKAAIASLDAVDQMLARVAIDDAIAAHADRSRVTSAPEEMTDARGGMAKRRLDLAIDHWKSAWREVTPPPSSH